MSLTLRADARKLFDVWNSSCSWHFTYLYDTDVILDITAAADDDDDVKCTLYVHRGMSGEDIANAEDCDDSAASTWLQELGIDQSRYRSLDPAKIREYLLL